MKKSLLTISLLALAAAPIISGCSLNKYEVGILQYGNFAALNNAREGFIAALKAKGYDTSKIDYKNADGKSTNVSTYADGMVGKYKLNLAIATPCAKMMKTAAINIGDSSPLLFTAVTDPTDGLVTNVAEPEGFVSGSSDLQPEEALTQQIQLAKKINKGMTKLGIIYCASESNSRIQADKATLVAQGESLEVITKTCKDALDVEETVMALANSGVGAIWIPTDNTVAGAIDKVKSGIGNKKILLISGEDGMLTGSHVTISINYYNLGYKTGEMAAGILVDGKTIKQTPVFYPTINDCSYEYHSTNLLAAGFSVSDLPSEYTWVDVAGK